MMEIGPGDWERWNDITEADIEAVGTFLRRGHLSVAKGGILARFEKRFARFYGTKFAVATNNGTAAIYAALWALGVRAGDEVAICDYGFHGMASAALALGAIIVPVDADPRSLTMDPADLANALSNRTRAILVHNPWGVPADYTALKQVAGPIPIVADASHAHGATYAGLPLGAHVEVACYSLGMGKLITGGELGCAATDNPEVRDRILAYGHVNRGTDEYTALDWSGPAVGLKLRPHSLSMVLAMRQLERYPHKQTLQTETGEQVETLFEENGFRRQALPAGAQRVYWRNVLTLDQLTADQPGVEDILTHLREAHIPVETNHYWPSLQHQKLFEWPDHRDKIRPRPCPAVAQQTPHTLTLPGFVDPSPEALAYLGQTVKGIMSQVSRLRRQDKFIPQAHLGG